MALDPAFFVFSGDLSDKGLPESYQHLRQIIDEEFKPFGVPVLLGWATTTTGWRSAA